MTDSNLPWTQDELMENLEIMVRECVPSKLKARTLLRRLRKLHRKKALYYDALPAVWWYRLSVCDLRRERYHWVGWDLRSDWAKKLSEDGWIVPKWQGHPSQRCVMVLCEQGLGEEIIFSSCFPDLMATGIRVIVACDWRLIPIFENSFTGDIAFINRYLDEDNMKLPAAWMDGSADVGEPVDCYIPAGNLPQVFRKKPDDFKGMWGGWLRPTLDFSGWGGAMESIGFCWGGRSGRLDPDRMIAPFPDADRINLQYDGTSHDSIRDVKQESLNDTFDIIAGLDKVVSVTATPAHMAAAMGVPVEVIRPPPIYMSETDIDEFNNRLRWHWQAGSPHPWYGNHVRTWENIQHWEKTRGKY